MSIAVFGSINIDITTYSQRLPQPGETLHGESFALALGGKGCNQAAAAAKLGADVALIGAVGKDIFADLALASIAEFGISDQTILRKADSGTGIATISVDAEAQNAITVIGGANMALTVADLDQSTEALNNASVLMLQMEAPLDVALTAAQRVRVSGGQVILDPAPAPSKGYDENVYSIVDIMTPNETETAILCGIEPTDADTAAKAAERLHQRGLATAIIKLGAKGVYYSHKNTEKGFIEPYSVNSIDTVAAGDCFNGGLAFGLTERMPLPDAVRFAAACGALSTTRKGAAQSAPSFEDVTALMSTQQHV